MKTEQEQNIVQKILGRLMSSSDEPVQSEEDIKNMLTIQPALLPSVHLKSVKNFEEGGRKD